ncbi:MAG: hypothetical protein A3A04_01700 [Candidatus Harrisonbacteria bacterium RIFCSPLOWO2_01_FULL_40_28]|uniref:Uncharacterized protein n=2 Tax=Candidatus Harrisoniibacteriota TaxID=1817905 RepID=A0A1G1ZY51_9BACT|nr:MAG: hypothetical protein A3A04_01700 [Candidatus Harrisonbacteria bacterium RIFCSPLOWO2_01_FULL_40_28]OGY68720.1 MAG: hypothetical protein A2586_00840 [Candidatus Harrisonbacteria bacterium RIFOXYD1_FULL_40_9]
MRIVFGLLLIISIGFLGVKIYAFNTERVLQKEKLGILNAEIDKGISENESLKADIQYFMNPYNLEKELRSKFNYKKSEEKMIIVVPDQ